MSEKPYHHLQDIDAKVADVAQYELHKNILKALNSIVIDIDERADNRINAANLLYKIITNQA